GRIPSTGNRAVDASPATGQAAKQKAKVIEPEGEDSSSEDDDPQTIAAALARKRSRADPQTDLWAEDEPVADRLVIDDSSPEVEERMSLPDTSREQPIATLLLEQSTPDSVPASGAVAQEPVPTTILREPPVEEDPNAIPNEEAVAREI
ncbi:hypothetical protein ABKV19_022637, partial [Rosa sericea]